jgi:3-dehydro-L-gulonate 2-dehydrogenase
MPHTVKEGCHYKHSRGFTGVRVWGRIAVMRIAFEKMYSELVRVLSAVGCEQEIAALCAKILTQNSCDGVYSHGLNMFPGIVKNIQNGVINAGARPKEVHSFGACGVWDGHEGPGISNAHFAMEEAIRIAERYGIGCVALRNTNHWGRAGRYAMEAAEANCIGICWTNTIPNMPPWGARSAAIGNNPLAVAVPRAEGHVIVDIAMSQFSYGKMKIYRRAGEQLPVCGGYDPSGRATTDPGSILEARRPMPIGFWKGSGLSIALDLAAAILSGGNSTYQIGKLGSERNVSQVFIAMDIGKISDGELVRRTIEETIAAVRGAEPDEQGTRACYPGERMLQTRNDNLKNGIPVDEEIWRQILDFV